MPQLYGSPSTNVVRAILDVIAPNHAGFSIYPLARRYSDHTHRIQIELADRPPKQIVLRRYNEASGNCASKSRREFGILKCLYRLGFPAPKPLLLDDEGDLLDTPCIVTEFVSGQQINAASEPLVWAATIDIVAQTLARIHTTPYDDTLRRDLMNANSEAAWFLKTGVVPEYMTVHPDGAQVWQTLHNLLPHRQSVAPALLHFDYWSGNILWDHGVISAVVDWEDAAYGDPAIDVAYCRMELYFEGLDDAADRLLHIYEATIGQAVANLGLWELAAAARAMHNARAWLTSPKMHQRFRRFISHAMTRATT